MEFLFNILIAFCSMLIIGAVGGVCFSLFTPLSRRKEKSKPSKEDASGLCAFVKCSGGGISERRYTFSDSPDCATADMLYGGLTECRFACLGFGSCVSVCTNHAISINDGVAYVSPQLCNGCGKCVDACPRAVIELVPQNAEIKVLCTSSQNGFELDKVCDIGCIGCGLCVNTCQYDAIQVRENVAVIDWSKCTACGECVVACPRGIISTSQKEKSEEFDENDYCEASEILEEAQK